MATKVEVVVLGLLAEGPMHGYDLLERFRSRSMGFWTELSRASAYQVLKRLERDGSIVGKAQEGHDGPDRRVFRITKLGRERLAEGVTEMAAALGAMHFGSGHEETAIGRRADAVGQRLPKRRPTRTALEFRCRIEQRLAATGADE